MDDLYRDYILEHYRRPHNFGVLEAPTASYEGSNPLCGDRITMMLGVHDGIVNEVAFTGRGCAISQASASLLTDEIKGKTVAEVERMTPDDVLDLYFGSLRVLGIEPAAHDMRLVEDDWESPTLGAWGLGWEVWLNGMEVTQFTYFQQVGGIECRPVPAEITYGLERLAMYIQGVDSVYDITWVEGVSYGDVFLRNEREYSGYNFDTADTAMLRSLFDMYEAESRRTLEAGHVLPAYDYVLKCSHAFNLLDARGAIAVTDRVAFIGRVRALARACAEAYVATGGPRHTSWGEGEHLPSQDAAPAAPTTAPLSEGGAK